MLTKTLPARRLNTKILIRPLKIGDCASLHAAVGESLAALAPWMPWCRDGYALADVKTWIAHCLAQWQTGSDREFGIIDMASDEVVGCVGINQIDHAKHIGNLGYWVRSERSGQGIATLAALQAAQFAFEHLALSQLEIVVNTSNQASCRVAEKTGACFEGIARNRLFEHGRPHDAAVYALRPGKAPMPGGARIATPPPGGTGW